VSLDLDRLADESVFEITNKGEKYLEKLWEKMDSNNEGIRSLSSSQVIDWLILDIVAKDGTTKVGELMKIIKKPQEKKELGTTLGRLIEANYLNWSKQ